MKTHNRIPAKQINIGDKISVNTGYKILDDEDCLVLDIKNTFDLFDRPNISFLIDSYYGRHWYDVNPESILYKVID